MCGDRSAAEGEDFEAIGSSARRPRSGSRFRRGVAAICGWVGGDPHRRPGVGPHFAPARDTSGATACCSHPSGPCGSRNSGAKPAVKQPRPATAVRPAHSRNVFAVELITATSASVPAAALWTAEQLTHASDSLRDLGIDTALAADARAHATHVATAATALATAAAALRGTSNASAMPSPAAILPLSTSTPGTPESPPPAGLDRRHTEVAELHVSDHGDMTNIADQR